MGEPLTKDELDRANAEWLAWRKSIDAPTPATKALPSIAALTAREKALLAGIAPFIHELEKRIEVLEAQRDEMRYCGTWREGKDYTAGSFATHDGAMWHANRRTSEKPGASGDWTMAAKSGQPTASPRPDAATSNPRNGHDGLPNPRFR
jgi:hypothetical protein